jgi:peptidoglycan/LPS O-acetylase OafA/YrhL
LFIVLIAILLYAPTFGVTGELVSVVLLFPALVMLGSATEPRNPAPYVLGGKISYALYVLHVPLLVATLNFYKQAGLTLNPPLTGLAFVVMLLAVCWLADSLFDVPVRRYLVKRILKR